MIQSQRSGRNRAGRVRSAGQFTKRVEEKEMDPEWECMDCGYLYEGKTPPKRCPDCGASGAWERVEYVDDFDDDEDWDDDEELEDEE